MLSIKDLKVSVEWKQILKWITYDIQIWNNYAFLWKNWSWKSTLAMSIMWHPNYKIDSGDIILDEKSILNLLPNLRSQAWIFLAFQNIPAVPWVKVFDFLKAIYNSHKIQEQIVSFLKFKKIVEPLLDKVWLEKEFLFRDLNVWFSGWEKRKLEILQMLLINPKIIILDEIDSWLDINSINNLWELLKLIDSKENSIIIISHYFKIIDYIDIDWIVILENWLIRNQWNKSLLNDIVKKWF